MAIDLHNWDPMYRIVLTEDPPGKVISAEHWTSEWQSSVLQGDYSQETLKAMLDELHTTAWHPTEGAASITNPAIYNDGALHVSGQLTELYDDLDNAKGDITQLFSDVAARRLLSVALDHNNPEDVIGTNEADSHPISAITDLQSTLDGITAGAIEVFSHNDISNRDVDEAHPMSAITGLTAWQTSVDEDLLRLDVLEAVQHNDLPGRDAAATHNVESIKYSEDSTLAQKLNNIDGVIANITGDVSTLTHNDLDGLTANNSHPISAITNLQTSLNAKQNNITGAASTVTSSNLTNARVVITSSSKLAVSGITTTQLNHLSGISSNIQNQINTKQKQITAGTAAPSGGVNGDVYIRYA